MPSSYTRRGDARPRNLVGTAEAHATPKAYVMGDARDLDLVNELSMLEGTSVLSETNATDGELLRALLAMLPVGVAAYDHEKLHYANAQARALLGASAEEALSAPQLFRYIDPEDWPTVIARREARMRGEPTPPVVIRLRHADGRRLAVSLETLDLRGPPSRMFLSVVHDVTEKLRLEEEARVVRAQKERAEGALRETQKLESLGVLAGGIAHDFNNLLASVYGSLSAIQHLTEHLPTATREALRPHLENAEAGATRAAELTRQLLAYGGRAPSAKTALDLGPLLAEILELLRVPMAKRITLSLDCAAGVPAIFGDPSQVRQVVMNLVTNAADALAGRDGAVRVTVRHVGALGADLVSLSPDAAGEGDAEAHRAADTAPAAHGYVTLAVSDDGRGMDEATRVRAFEPFFSTKGPGRGLGLATTQGILRSHGARLAVVTAPERGTVVTVAFPALGADIVPSRAKKRESAPPGPRLDGRTVLLVDDERRARFALAFLLRKRGLAVIEAENGLDAVEVVAERGDTLDAVVMDLTMPKLSGRDAATQMLATHPSLPIVLTSGYAEGALDNYAERDKVFAFLEKPFREEALVKVLASAFRARKAPPTGPDMGDE